MLIKFQNASYHAYVKRCCKRFEYFREKRESKDWKVRNQIVQKNSRSASSCRYTRELHSGTFQYPAQNGGTLTQQFSQQWSAGQATMVPVWHIQPYLSVICSGVFRLGRRPVLSLSLSRHFSPVQERALVRATKLDTRFRFLSHESCRLLCNQTRHAPVQFFTGKRLTRERKPWRARAKFSDPGERERERERES